MIHEIVQFKYKIRYLNDLFQFIDIAVATKISPLFKTLKLNTLLAFHSCLLPSASCLLLYYRAIDFYGLLYMPRSKIPSSSISNTKSLAISPLHERLGTLEAEQQRLLERIKKKRKELDNLVDNIRSVVTEIFQRTSPYLQNMSVLDQKIHALFAEILSGSKLGKQTRKKIEKVYLNLQLSGLIHVRFTDEDEDEEVDEMEDQEEVDNFSDTSESTSSSESTIPSSSSRTSEEFRHIRQTFLKLAENFHPDKVTDTQTQTHYTEIMKELNRAYKERDLSRLLEIERQHLAKEQIDPHSETDLTRRCEIIERENQVLKQQYEHLLQELNLFKQTPEGELVKEYRRAKKEKIDFVQSMIEELQEQVDLIEEIHQFVQDFRDKKMTISKFMKGPDAIARKQQEFTEEMLEEYFF